MRNRLLAIGLACLAAIILVILLRQKTGGPSDSANNSAPAAKPGAPILTATPGTLAKSDVTIAGSATPARVSAQPPLTPGVSTSAAGSAPVVSREIEFTNFAPAIVLENLRTVFHQYASALGGNPVGNNAEITAALKGENPKQANFLKEEEGQRVNEKGELIDSWGTPYFFHALSGTEMEIHSAGPDGVMWTADDLVIK
jgi:hypothetical protein